MGVMITSASYPPKVRAMVFIDGGYFRALLKKELGTEEINWNLLDGQLLLLGGFGGYQLDLVRKYYYDANYYEQENKLAFEQNEKFFTRLRSLDCFEVRISRLKESADGPRQKGTDVMLSVDMVTKAYQGQFDVAIVIAGDDDFIDAVKSVKDAGKRVIGIYSATNASKGLVESFDMRRPLTAAELKRLLAEG